MWGELMDMRGVSQTPDGRYYVRFRKGRDKKEPWRTKRYFGRGEEALASAKRYLKTLPDRRLYGSSEYKDEFEKYRAEKNQTEKEINRLQGIVNCSANIKEQSVRDNLACALILYGHEGVAVEVTVPVGRIDVLTDKYIIEVKHDVYWKEALGQLISYKVFYPDKTPVLYIFSKAHLQKTTPVDDRMILEMIRAMDTIGGIVVVDSAETFFRLNKRMVRVGFFCFFEGEANLQSKLKKEKKRLYNINKLEGHKKSLLQAADVS